MLSHRAHLIITGLFVIFLAAGLVVYTREYYELELWHPDWLQFPSLLGFSPDDDDNDEGEELEQTQEQAEDDFETLELPGHPIDDLRALAEGQLKSVLSKQTKGLKEAVDAYRLRRGRHPPPGFEEWVAYAEEHDTLMIESFFDQIQDDLEPFWGLPASKIRDDAGSWTHLLSIRNGSIRRRDPTPVHFDDWLARWKGMLEAIPVTLPDVDMAFNMDDEPHIFVPWEQMTEYKAAAIDSRHVKAPDELDFLSEYSNYPPIAEEPTFVLFPDAPSEDNLWILTRDTCHNESVARHLDQDPDFTTPARFPDQDVNMDHKYQGYVANWTATKSLCENPHLANLHGYMINANHKSFAHWNDMSDDRLTTRVFFPLFSACKLQSVNNDILIPSAIYWGASRYFENDAKSWSKKLDKVIWRGSASGQVNNATNWTRFHRHRFIAMQNGTQVQLTIDSQEVHGLPAHVPGGTPTLPHNFPIPNTTLYPLGALTVERDLGRWIASFSDCHFNTLLCYPWTDFYKNQLGKFCWYTSDYFSPSERVPMNVMFKAKYLPDIDGHSYSGRWETFLESDSVPIKATVWSEWHSNRLIPWRHFVPMDNTYIDWYGIMDYFLGYQPPPGLPGSPKHGHDHVAKAIADEGRNWSAKVLRQQDILLYTWRLVLEYARVCDDNRDRLGYVDDLR